MTFVKTYTTNDTIQSSLPFTLSSTSRPTKDDVETFRMRAYGIINTFLGGAQSDAYGGLKDLETRKVLEMINNYYRLSRGEDMLPIFITDEDLRLIRLNDTSSGDGYGGGHVSKQVP